MRLETKEAFKVSGQKVWISGQNNEEFASFWKEATESGLVKKLQDAAASKKDKVTKSSIFGVSRVEEDPNNRAFYFYIASESENVDGCESFEIAGGEWAIFEGDGDTPMALINAELEAFMNWLPNSEYKHDNRPEIEVYPENSGVYVEFWLPVCRK